MLPRVAPADRKLTYEELTPDEDLLTRDRQLSRRPPRDRHDGSPAAGAAARRVGRRQPPGRARGRPTARRGGGAAGALHLPEPARRRSCHRPRATVGRSGGCSTRASSTRSSTPSTASSSSRSCASTRPTCERSSRPRSPPAPTSRSSPTSCWRPADARRQGRPSAEDDMTSRRDDGHADRRHHGRSPASSPTPARDSRWCAPGRRRARTRLRRPRRQPPLSARRAARRSTGSERLHDAVRRGVRAGARSGRRAARHAAGALRPGARATRHPRRSRPAGSASATTRPSPRRSCASSCAAPPSWAAPRHARRRRARAASSTSPISRCGSRTAAVSVVHRRCLTGSRPAGIRRLLRHADLKGRGLDGRARDRGREACACSVSAACQGSEAARRGTVSTVPTPLVARSFCLHLVDLSAEPA